MISYIAFVLKSSFLAAYIFPPTCRKVSFLLQRARRFFLDMWGFWHETLGSQREGFGDQFWGHGGVRSQGFQNCFPPLDAILKRDGAQNPPQNRYYSPWKWPELAARTNWSWQPVINESKLLRPKKAAKSCNYLWLIPAERPEPQDLRVHFCVQFQIIAWFKTVPLEPGLTQGNKKPYYKSNLG